MDIFTSIKVTVGTPGIKKQKEFSSKLKDFDKVLAKYPDAQYIMNQDDYPYCFDDNYDNEPLNDCFMVDNLLKDTSSYSFIETLPDSNQIVSYSQREKIGKMFIYSAPIPIFQQNLDNDEISFFDLSKLTLSLKFKKAIINHIDIYYTQIFTKDKSKNLPQFLKDYIILR